MRTKLLSAAAAIAVVAIAGVAPASAAVFPVGTTQADGSFLATQGANGTFNGAIARTNLGAGTFTDTFTFTLPTDGYGSGAVVTSAGLFHGLTDLDFSSVTINGTSLAINTSFGGLVENAADTGLKITAGQLNTLTVSGISYGGASYGGNLTFIPASAVPETATWAMMLMGFGMMGAGLRYRRRKSTVAYA